MKFWGSPHQYHHFQTDPHIIPSVTYLHYIPRTTIKWVGFLNHFRATSFYLIRLNIQYTKGDQSKTLNIPKPRFLDIVNMKRIGFPWIFPPFFHSFPMVSGYWPKVLALRCQVGEPDAFPPRCSPWPRWFRGG